MSDNAVINVRMILGRGDRSITEQGEELRRPILSAAYYAGVRRQIVFHNCKNPGGDIEWSGETFDVYVTEQPPEQRPWPDQPWRIGSISQERNALNLYVSPVLVQQLWDTADNEGAVLHIAAHSDPSGFFRISQARLEVPPRAHPVVIELERQRQIFRQWARELFIGLCGIAVVIIVIQLITHWLWR